MQIVMNFGDDEIRRPHEDDDILCRVAPKRVWRCRAALSMLFGGRPIER
jgi:hypothetical protein